MGRTSLLAFRSTVPLPVTSAIRSGPSVRLSPATRRSRAFCRGYGTGGSSCLQYTMQSYQWVPPCHEGSTHQWATSTKQGQQHTWQQEVHRCEGSGIVLYVLSAASTVPQQEPAVFRRIRAEGCKQRTTAGLKQACIHYGIFLLQSGVIQDEDHDWLNDAQLESVIMNKVTT